MKIAITGHTSGIGLALFEYFTEQGHDVIGFSRSNGFNISDSESRQSILKQVEDFDIFVNNAYNDYDNSQLELLKIITSSWENFPRIVFNISSKWTIENNIYSRTKLELDRYCETFLYNKKLNLINLKPGLVDTPRVKTIGGERMSTQRIVDLVDYIIASGLRFQTVTFSQV